MTLSLITAGGGSLGDLSVNKSLQDSGTLCTLRIPPRSFILPDTTTTTIIVITITTTSNQATLQNADIPNYFIRKTTSNVMKFNTEKIKCRLLFHWRSGYLFSG